MSMANKELGIYIVIALAIIIAAAVIANGLLAGNYSVRVSMSSMAHPAQWYPYQTSRITIMVNNTGTSKISDLSVGFYINGMQQSSYKVTIPAGKSATILTNYTYPANGTYLFKAVADPGNLMSIANRSGTQSSMLINVNSPARPDVYTSIPNDNITLTQSFTFTSQGAYSAAVLADGYNISLFDRMFTPARQITVKIFELLNGYMARANGAYVSYASNASAYTLWLQGTLNPPLINYVVSSFHASNRTITENGTTIYFWKIDNETSLCTYYEGGWTKVITFDNASGTETCAAFAMRNFNSTESSALVGALKNNSNLTVFQSRFMYINASVSGTSLVYGNGTFGAANMFEVPGTQGFFTGYIQTNNNASANETPVCRGLLSTDANGSVCSTYIVPASGKADSSYALINTTEVFDNYVLTMYSLVNSSSLINAHKNAVLLFKSLGINGTYLPWTTAFKNACFLHNVSGINCSVNAFNYTSNSATVLLTNNMSTTLHVNSIGCFMPGANFNYTFNTSLSQGESSNFTVKCVNIPVPIVSAKSSYIFVLNYTLGGAYHNAIGALNVTTPGFG